VNGAADGERPGALRGQEGAAWLREIHALLDAQQAEVVGGLASAPLGADERAFLSGQLNAVLNLRVALEEAVKPQKSV